MMSYAGHTDFGSYRRESTAVLPISHVRARHGLSSPKLIAHPETAYGFFPTHHYGTALCEKLHPTAVAKQVIDFWNKQSDVVSVKSNMSPPASIH